MNNVSMMILSFLNYSQYQCTKIYPVSESTSVIRSDRKELSNDVTVCLAFFYL
jgi:hypothetical protein